VVRLQYRGRDIVRFRECLTYMHQGEGMVEPTILEMLDEASSKARTGDILGAVESYRKATELDGSSASAWYGLAVMQAKRGNTADAVSAFEQAHILNPNHAPTAANLAVLLEVSDSVRASALAKQALETLSDVEELTRIADNHPTDEPLILSARIVEEEPEPPLLESKAISEEPPLLEANPVLMEITNVVELASDLVLKGEFQEALNLIQPRLEGDASDNAQLWAMCGVCLSQLEHVDDAIQAIEYAISMGEDSAKVHFNLAQLLRKSNREDDAMQSLANALLCDPSHINSLVARGEIFRDRGDDELAAQNWRRVITMDPENPINNRLVELEEEESSRSRKLDGLSSEEGEVEEVEKVEPSFVETKSYKISKAHELTDSGNHVAAVNAWKELLQEDSQSAEIWHGLADALSVAGHIERAHQCRQRANAIEEGIRIEDEEDEAVVVADLIEAATQAAEKTGHLPSSEQESVNVSIEWYNKGLNLLAEDNSIEALNCFEKAIGGAPREEQGLRVRAQNGRGHALYQLGRYPESIQAYHAAITMDPAGVTGRALYNMGSSYAAVELYSDAIKCFEQALDRGLDKDDVNICKTQINRCKLLHKEQEKQRRAAV